MSASKVVSSSSTQSELFNFNHPLSPESVSGHSSDSDSCSGSDDRSSSHSHSHHSPISTASHHSQGQHNGAYPTTEPQQQQQQQQGQPITRATTTNNIFPERPLVPTCPADWEAKKDVIYDLYMNKNFILNDVVEIMLSTHRFKATARMYKGQFAKWRWAKYNKSGNTNATKPTKSRSVRRKGITSSGSGGHSSNGHVSKPGCQANFISQPAQMIRLYFQSEPTYLVESTLLAYASYIARWADPERETPWKTAVAGPQLQISSDEINTGDHATMTSNSILQNIALAIRHLRCNNPQGTTKGGALLRHAFLQIEEAITTADDGDIQAIWDCCLAIPQLLILHNASSTPSPTKQQQYQPPHDILPIYTRFLHHLTTLKYAQAGCTSHPLHQISSSLHHLVATSDFASLHLFITRAWKLWINTCRQLRGETDHVTIHLKRGYVILMDPEHAIVKNLVSDFGGLVRREMERWGEGKTTERILELEGLLGRMYLPLFDAGVVVGPGTGTEQGVGGTGTGAGTGTGVGAGQRARGMLGGLVERLEEKYRVKNRGGFIEGVSIGNNIGSGNGMVNGNNNGNNGIGTANGNNITSAPRPQDLPPAPTPSQAPAPGQPPGPQGPPIPMHHWGYLDRYLFFSAHHFLASIADYEGDASTAVALRRKILVMNGGGLPGSILSSTNSQTPFGTFGTSMGMNLGLGLNLGMTLNTMGSVSAVAAGMGMGMGMGASTRGRDQFWVQTSRKVETYLRSVGKWEEAEEVRGLLRDQEREAERQLKRKRMEMGYEQGGGLMREMGRDLIGPLGRDNMQVVPMPMAMARSGSVTGSAIGAGVELLATPGAGLHMGGGGIGGRSMSVPTIPFQPLGIRSGALGTFTPRSYSSLQPLDEFDTLDPGFDTQGFGRLPIPIPPVPIPRSVPVPIPPPVPTSRAGFVVDKNLPTHEEFDDFQQFERAAMEMSGSSAGGSGGSSSTGENGGSEFHHGNHGNGERYNEDRWGRWHEVLAL